jgi:hypothetical protein
MHQGIELGVTATPVKEVTLRWSGAYSKHKYVHYREKGEVFDGNEMMVHLTGCIMPKCGTGPRQLKD